MGVGVGAGVGMDAGAGVSAGTGEGTHWLEGAYVGWWHRTAELRKAPVEHTP